MPGNRDRVCVCGRFKILTDTRFCFHCGHALAVWEDHGVERLRCPVCGYITYDNAKPCAGVLITQDRQVLLVRRGIEPFKDYWDIPGGFLDGGEHPTDGARREAREETGLTVELLGALATYMDRYRSQGDDVWTLNMYYVARPVSGEPRAADDAVDVRWFDADDLPEQMAFPDHAHRVLADWRGWIEHPTDFGLRTSDLKTSRPR